MREIVAIMTNDGFIINDPIAVKHAALNNNVKDFLSRDKMQFMADADLGIRWELLAKGPTLMRIDENNKVYDGIFKVKE